MRFIKTNTEIELKLPNKLRFESIMPKIRQREFSQNCFLIWKNFGDQVLTEPFYNMIESCLSNLRLSDRAGVNEIMAEIHTHEMQGFP